MLTAAWALAAALVLLAPARHPAGRTGGRRHAAWSGSHRTDTRRGSDGSDASRGAPGRPRHAPVAVLHPLAVVMVGAACVAVAGPLRGAIAAAVCCPGAWLLGERLRRRPAHRRDDPGLPIVLDLIAAGLRAGRPPADAIARAAPAAGDADRTDLTRVAGLLRLGADADQAWAASRDGPLGPVAAVAVRSAASGIRVATAFEGLAIELRDRARAAAAMRAHRAGVRAMGPLAACFLPSFVCLGVVPVVVGVARNAFAVLP